MLSSTRWGTDLVKLVDFGISRAMASATQQFTSTGMIVGTPDYMSPEQLTGDALDSRSDQYSLALIAYYALCGVLPFPGGTSKDALMTRLTTPPRPLAEAKPDVHWPASLQATLDRALALDAKERFEEVLDFGRALDAAIGEMPGTETMERYREALRQRFTTPTRAPLVTPPRAMPSLERTPVAPMPSVEPVAEISAASEARVDAQPSSVTALGGARRRRPLLARRATAIGVTLAVVGGVVWKLAAAGPSAPTVPSLVDSSALSLAPVTHAALAAGVVAPALPLDSIASLARGSVFPLYGDGQQGSAFLVDSIGILLTAADFARDGSEPRVQLDPERRVVARVMVVDAARGIAALRIPIQHCRGCSTLALATDSASRASVGDSLVVPAAVTRGSSPVSSRGAVTQADGRSLQASLRVTDRAVIGAPALGDDGVVALVRRVRGGQPTLVGAEALATLRAAALRRRGEVLPNDTLVPTWPAAPVLRSEINAAKGRSDAQLAVYKVVQDGFELLAMTPQVMAWRFERIKAKVAGAQLMAIGDSQPRRNVDPIQGWREWNAYVGERRAVVVLHATPEIAGYDRLSPLIVVDLKRGNVAAMRLYRGDTLVRPIEEALIPAVVDPVAYRSKNLPVYRAGVAAYHPREFARRGGRFPPLVVELVEAGTRRSTRVALSEAALSAIERDLRTFQR
jgi:S1-C subfamily serine protease